MSTKASLLYIPAVILLLLGILPLVSHAGSLERFEESITENSSHDDTKKSKTSCQDDNLDFGCFVLDAASNIISHIVAFGGSYSFYRVNSAQADNKFNNHKVPPRLIGEPLIPFARLDLNYLYNSSNLKAYDYRIEVGYAAVAMGYNQTRYIERKPSDSLTLSRIYGLYRMSIGPYLELDWGMGSLKVDGNQTRSYLYLTTPILIHASPKVGFEFRPSWADNLYDYDISILFKSTYTALKIGYRKLSSNVESLEGPYVGLSAHY